MEQMFCEAQIHAEAELEISWASGEREETDWMEKEPEGEVEEQEPEGEVEEQEPYHLLPEAKELEEDEEELKSEKEPEDEVEEQEEEPTPPPWSCLFCHLSNPPLRRICIGWLEPRK